MLKILRSCLTSDYHENTLPINEDNDEVYIFGNCTFLTAVDGGTERENLEYE
jgi:hypothetical protein